MFVDKNFPTSSTSNADDDDLEDKDKRTIFCANLDSKVSEELLWELFIQGGPVESVRIPTDKDGRKRNFGFVTYAHSCSVQYALELFDGIRLFNRILTMRANNSNQQQQVYQSQRYKIPPLPTLRKDNSISNNRNSNKSSYDNSSALRLGGSCISSVNSHIRFNSDMQPRHSKDVMNEKHKNPFKVNLDVLSRLSSYLLPPKERQNNKTGNSNNSFAKPSPNQNRNRNDISKRSFQNNREQNKIHPYKRPNKIRHEERSGNNLFGNERKRGHRERRRR